VDLNELKIERTKPTAQRRRGNPWTLRVSVAVALLAALWLFGPSVSAWTDRMRLLEVKTLVVRAPAAAAAAAISGTAANGYVIAARRAALSSDVPGRIVEMLVQEGSVVKQGDVVARLYRDEFAAALARAEAEVKVAESGVARSKAAELAARADEQQSQDAVASQQQLLAEANAQSRFAQAELQRSKDLLQQGIGSPRDVERAQSEGSMAEARVRSLEAVLRRTEQAQIAAKLRVEVAGADQQVATAQLQAASAARQQAQATLDKTDVKAPFDGVVVLKDAEVGEVVSPNVQGGSNARGAVCTMVDFDSLEVQANVPETALQAVQLGAPAEVFLDAFPDRGMKGRVDRIWPTADRQKATVEVRVKLLERREELRPEMGVRIVFQKSDPATAPDATTASPTKATAILPETAVVEIEGKSGAFLVERDTVRFVELRIAERKAGQVGIEAGVRPGQTVVVEPPASLKTGDRIRIAAN